MSVALKIDPEDTAPPYEQLRAQIEAAIISGALEGGTKLPTVRQLAADLEVAPGTVMRAYAMLSESGLVESRRGRGSVVALGVANARLAGVAVGELATEYVRKARLLGAPDSEILGHVENSLKAEGA
ncbi:MAG: GntR family transcriptional regulator [Mobiluncus porci]|uniref:GntR family transcriptional regulator n=1 Tax=Mobiluncus porci TaxID=2652278 RepID=A0A7K0K3R8_9ACTO|nr:MULTISPECIES: GntR family transcriptional regulator [Mobiluncus]MCI6583972.1 GntR family transcriptional regulator [Mobiluncus sp.]MDD7542490.1 GntR family transcriptional regulator [Mobiluncus porci]MDY5748787.1 GntR family transcriptional regulator [Mobiluncus porci]MST50074.1 GntR family transcriptional regulator [Mobiluncus porci]